MAGRSGRCEETIRISCSVALRYSKRGLLGRLKHREEEFLLDMGSFAGSLYATGDFHNLAVANKGMIESLKKINKRNDKANNEARFLAYCFLGHLSIRLCGR